jgi:hypothetical protein
MADLSVMLIKCGSAKSTESELLVENRTCQSGTDIKMFLFVQISVWCCSFSLAVSVGAALLLPISTISNEVNSVSYVYKFSWRLHGTTVLGLFCSSTQCKYLKIQCFGAGAGFDPDSGRLKLSSR